MRCLVVGLGRWGRFHCQKVIAHPKMTLVGVVDIDETRISSAAESFRVQGHLHPNLSAESDCWIVATDKTSLAPVCRLGLSQGVSLLIEKPGATSATELLSLVRADNTQRVSVGYQLRQHPAVANLSAGGHLFFERAEAGFDSLWEMLLDCAVHDIDLACFLLKPPYRWVTVQLGYDVLRATLQSSDERRAYFHWKIGDVRVRTVANHNVRVDFTENRFDLLSLQLDAFLGAQSDMDGRGLANLEDGLMVMNLLESLKAKVGTL